jgi:hypothetical protein
MNTELIEQNMHRLLGAMTGAATTAMVADAPGAPPAATPRRRASARTACPAGNRR